ADAIGFPVAVKAVSGEIAHRAAAGFVALNVAAAEEVANVFERLQAKASAQGTPLDGCYIQRMARPGVELLVSAFRDPIFGPVVVCGAGGVLTELIGDVWLARAPVDRATATKRLRAMRL